MVDKAGLSPQNGRYLSYFGRKRRIIRLFGDKNEEAEITYLANANNNKIQDKYRK